MSDWLTPNPPDIADTLSQLLFQTHSDRNRFLLHNAGLTNQCFILFISIRSLTVINDYVPIL